VRGLNAEYEQLRRQVLAEEDRCWRCGSGVDLTVGHVTPRSRGGLNVRSNLHAECAHCNYSVKAS
jgi:5-methylcytosine-specific restriction endonuclease McrA